LAHLKKNIEPIARIGLLRTQRELVLLKAHEQ